MTDPGLKLFISHLPLTWDEEATYQYFQAYGKISSVELFHDQYGGINQLAYGCAYVKFCIKAEGEETMKKINHSQAL